MRLLLLLLVSVPGLALANSPTSPTGVPQPTAELKTMTDRLHLSRSQQDQIAPILVAEADKIKVIQDEPTLSVQDKHNQSGAVHRAALRQIKAVFTPEQLALVEQGQDHPQSSPTHP